MSKRNLFVSFAESDGGHSYLAARAMLDPGSIAHLIFRNTVSESLEAVAAGQANYAVVPCYNSITQWDGATLKALASGGFEIFAQLCMPTSYVLVAHKDYMSEFVAAYTSIKTPDAILTPEDEAKIYTRFLSRIFVGPQAEEQYRGRLVRPDMTHATIELSRNPLRILEELTRSDLLKAMTSSPRSGGGYGPLPGNVSGGGINIGSAPVLSPAMPAMTAIMETLQAPAALVAAGLLDAPGDPDGWDQPGSLGEIVSLLRKLLVLLNVYSLGSPDLPENKTQYLLLGRRGAGAPPANAIRSPAAAPTRITALVKPSSKKSSADQWLKPRGILAKKARDFGFVFDRAPMMLSPGNQRIFLFEGGRPKDGVAPNPIGAVEGMLRWMGELFAPPSDGSGKPSGGKSKDKTLRKVLEQKAEGNPKDNTPGKFDTQFLGQYPAWCHGLSDDACWCCEEAHADTHQEKSVNVPQLLIATLVAATILALLFFPAYCAISGSCTWFSQSPALPKLEAPPSPFSPPPVIVAPEPAKILPPKPTMPEPVRQPYPGLGQKPAAPVESAPVKTAPPVVATPKYDIPKPPPVFHVAFFEAKSNLTREAQTALGSAASQSIQQNRTVNIRIVALGARETDDELWRRRLYAVKDELVRLGVPANRIRNEGTGPYILTIRSNQPAGPASRRQRLTYDVDVVPDPMMAD
ncbi:MAG: hypothetical protein K8S25_18245 [Alphaproteobacteria bacterium]|nr:hypothetical protein [Alphaproteobacteria bacterium]